ncbi:MAG: SDR family NAD(P)-dependent oxidoreductase [Oscillospiraceae bacterium]|nr:SDR family NAD(P)-dependent oxidoreductase [Oscillospiraceae bacterium]
MLLQGKTAIITGANRGIGRAVLQSFAQNGASIFACARNLTPAFLQDMENLAAAFGVSVFPVQLDVTSQESIQAATKAIMQQKLSIDILVNNAGAFPANGLFQMTPCTDIKNVFDTNFFGPMAFTQGISRLMARKKKGSIVNIGSVAGLDGGMGQFAYSASKAALSGATKTLAAELAGAGIRVNTVAPGLIDTDMAAGVRMDIHDTLVQESAMKRLGTPEEVAGAVLFFASELSAFVTGQTLRVDGGI